MVYSKEVMEVVQDPLVIEVVSKKVGEEKDDADKGEYASKNGSEEVAEKENGEKEVDHALEIVARDTSADKGKQIATNSDDFGQGPIDLSSLSFIQAINLETLTQAKASEDLLESHSTNKDLISLAGYMLEKILPSFKPDTSHPFIELKIDDDNANVDTSSEVVQYPLMIEVVSEKVDEEKDDADKGEYASKNGSEEVAEKEKGEKEADQTLATVIKSYPLITQQVSAEKLQDIDQGTKDQKIKPDESTSQAIDDQSSKVPSSTEIIATETPSKETPKVTTEAIGTDTSVVSTEQHTKEGQVSKALVPIQPEKASSSKEKKEKRHSFMIDLSKPIVLPNVDIIKLKGKALIKFGKLCKAKAEQERQIAIQQKNQVL
ncbi:uncharacterized protein LOC131856978 [Cryptomeria japonica]|uniref:uncharacterized protein LOC131856978 n=1 Tax=Cryptomeria japonica TaxID=3369 RepID=UPI0027DA8407|nr:uncharacterized protein LOC131856978 [Cryptomeria japonica]